MCLPNDYPCLDAGRIDRGHASASSGLPDSDLSLHQAFQGGKEVRVGYGGAFGVANRRFRLRLRERRWQRPSPYDGRRAARFPRRVVAPRNVRRRAARQEAPPPGAHAAQVLREDGDTVAFLNCAIRRRCGSQFPLRCTAPRTAMAGSSSISCAMSRPQSCHP